MSNPRRLGSVLHLTRVVRLASRAAAVTTLLAAGQPLGATEVQRPFAALAGSWAGRGTISTLGGVEHATCTASYQVAASAAKLTFKCATESFRLNLTGSVVDERGTISGTWSEQGFGTSGMVSGRASGDRLGFAANVAGAQVTVVIATQGARQTVSLKTTSPFLTDGALVLLRQG